MRRGGGVLYGEYASVAHGALKAMTRAASVKRRRLAGTFVMRFSPLFFGKVFRLLELPPNFCLDSISQLWPPAKAPEHLKDESERRFTGLSAATRELSVTPFRITMCTREFLSPLALGVEEAGGSVAERNSGGAMPLRCFARCVCLYLMATRRLWRRRNRHSNLSGPLPPLPYSGWRR